jgi:hypothetical protein
MSVTFSGGITFTGGGFSFSAAPPSTPTAGWFGGGTTPSYVSTVQRITYATDTATATVRGPLSYAVNRVAATGTLTDGWFGGGYAGSPTSRTTRVTFATDTAASTSKGPLSEERWGLSATSDGSTYGWFGGGYGYPPPPTRQKSVVDRITYANDTATASIRGPLATARISLAAVGTTSYGWFGGGTNVGQQPGNTGLVSTVDRIDYSNDTATATAKGPLSLARQQLAAVSDGTTYGWFGGGLSPGSNGTVSTIDRITYATDTTTASVRGSLSQTVSRLAGTGDANNGWFGGGDTGFKSTVQRITYATDTADASVRGPLSLAATFLGATSGLQ